MHSKDRKRITKKIVDEPKLNEKLKKYNNGRADDAICEQRLKYIHDSLVACQNRHEIIKNTKSWGLSQTAIDAYITKARALMIEELKEGRAARKALYRLRLEKQYLKADKGETPQDARAAAQIMEIEARILGDTAPMEVELIEKKQQDLSKLTDEELRTFQAILKKIES